MTSKKQGSRPGARSPSTTPENSAPGALQGENTIGINDLGDADLEVLTEVPSFTPREGLLSQADQRFCAEYLVDMVGGKAYQRAKPHVQLSSAYAEGHKLLQRPEIRAEIQRLMDERASLTAVTSDRVLLRFWETGTTDPRALVEVRIGACRHCWGEYNQRQMTDAEYERAEHKHIQAQAKARNLANKQGTAHEDQPFHGAGGPGFTPNRQPNPDCPECFGDGTPRHIIKDTRDLTPAQAALFGGVKLDKHGNLSVLVRDPMASLVKVGEHLGLWSDKLKGPQNADPLSLLLEQLRGAHGHGAALGVVTEDPEQRKPGDMTIEDATPRPAKAKVKKPRQDWRAA